MNDTQNKPSGFKNIVFVPVSEEKFMKAAREIMEEEHELLAYMVENEDEEEEEKE